jgi:hypothetical protein
MSLHLITPAFDVAFLTFQSSVVAILLLHDWIPLGRFNNLAALRSADPLTARLVTTIIPLIPTALALYFCAQRFTEPYSHDLKMLLWITYGILLIGMLRAWWIPYLVTPDPKRAARYQVLFAGTHTVLPVRNGMVPNSLHIVLHLVTFATFVLIAIRTYLV